MAPLPTIAVAATSVLGDKVVTTAGHVIIIENLLNAAEKSGLQILIAASSISLFSIIALLVLLGIAAIKTFRQPSENRFIRTHVVAYFISLLLCDVISAIGSLMNGNWVSSSAVQLGQICTAQGALKNTGNVGSAMWSMVIAIHTFCLLVLKWRSSDRVLYITLGLVWTFIAVLVLVGPVVVQNLAAKGPYYGVAGYWCWITDAYGAQRMIFEYFWMFLSALTSLILYTSVFFSLRGNLIVQGWRIGFQRTSQAFDKDGSGLAMAKAYSRHMILYPIIYLIVILPISICRYMQWAGHTIAFEVLIFADTVFLLSGFINVVLFTSTRRLIPTYPSSSTGHSRNPSDIESQASNAPLVHPYLIRTEKLNISPIRASTVPQRPLRPSMMGEKKVMGLKTLSLVVMMANRASKVISPKHAESQSGPRMREVQPTIQAPVQTRLPPRRTNASLPARTTSNEESLPSPEYTDIPLKTPLPLPTFENPSQILYVPPTIPVPSLQPRKALPKRGVSVAPTLKSVYSQASDSEESDNEGGNGFLSVRKNAGVRSSLVTPPMPRIMTMEERMAEEKGLKGDSGYASSEDESEGEKEERAMKMRLQNMVPQTPMSADIAQESFLGQVLMAAKRVSIASKFSDDASPSPRPYSVSIIPSAGADVQTGHSYGFPSEYFQSSADESSPIPPVPARTQVNRERHYTMDTEYSQDSRDEISIPVPPVPTQAQVTMTPAHYQLTAGLKSDFDHHEHEHEGGVDVPEDVTPDMSPIQSNEDERKTLPVLETSYNAEGNNASPPPVSSDSMESPFIPSNPYPQMQGHEDSRKSYGLETVYSQDSADDSTPPPLPTSFQRQRSKPHPRRPVLRLSSPSDTVRPLSIMKRRDSKVSIMTPSPVTGPTGRARASFESDRTSHGSFRPLPIPPVPATSISSAYPTTQPYSLARHESGSGRSRSGSNASTSTYRPLPSPFVRAPLTSVPTQLQGSHFRSNSTTSNSTLAPPQYELRPQSVASTASVYSAVTNVESGVARNGSVSSTASTKRAPGTRF